MSKLEFKYDGTKVLIAHDDVPYWEGSIRFFEDENQYLVEVNDCYLTLEELEELVVTVKTLKIARGLK